MMFLSCAPMAAPIVSLPRVTRLPYVHPRLLFSFEDTFHRIRLLSLFFSLHAFVPLPLSSHFQLANMRLFARLATPQSAKSNGQSPTNGELDPGVSVRFGAVQHEDVKMRDADEDARGFSKRKSRASIDQKKSYAEPDSSDEDDQPLVRPI